MDRTVGDIRRKMSSFDHFRVDELPLNSLSFLTRVVAVEFNQAPARRWDCDAGSRNAASDKGFVELLLR